MKIHHKKMSGTAFPSFLKTCGSLIASCSLLVLGAQAAEAFTVSGDSTSILRMRETTEDKDLLPLYEYLHLSGSDTGKDGTTSVFLGGWARGDLRDNTTNQNSNGDLQYGYLSYRGNKSNLQANAGRQYVNEGVAAEKLDGLYLRGDLMGGFTASAFAGSPVETEPNSDPTLGQGSFIYGGRIAHSSGIYGLGLSALKEIAGGHHLREEEAIDLWLRPLAQIDLAGRSSYSSATGAFMEHAYTLAISPSDMVRISGSLSQVNYRHYFHHVTTSALSLNNTLVNPEESVLATGINVGITPLDKLTVSGDFKHYNYDIAGDANYFGGNIRFLPIASLSTGLSIHRMNGTGTDLRYDEYHVFATQKIGRTDVTLDFYDVNFDATIYGRKNTYTWSGAVGYDFPRNVRVAADLEYARSTDYDHDVRGLVKVVYAFGSEKGGTK